MGESRRSAELERLNDFIGVWHAEGISYADGQDADDPYGSGDKWVSDEVYEWLDGGFFLVHRWHAMVGSRPFNGLEVIGYDDTTKQYVTRFFDNAGFSPSYLAEVHGRDWTFVEENTRARVTIGDDGQSMQCTWEWKNGGRGWLPLCNRTAVRVAAPVDPSAMRGRR